MSANRNAALLQGTSNLPEGVLISRLVERRAKEIQELERLASQSSSTKLVFQKLPKHLRRRAMSHQVKRLPRVARVAHMNQMIKSGLPPKTKRPSRKFKRRPNNLLKDYIRRQRKHIWLATHIWHAKRFRMVDRWGYRLPFKPNDKAFRACYRASAHHCLLQDISYISCIEIIGLKSVILNQLKLITNPDTGLTIGARAFQNGNREGEIMIYHKNSYPHGAIGLIKFIWKPEEIDNEKCCLWLWIHAAFYNELLNCLFDVFDLKEINSEDYIDKCYSNERGHLKLTELKHSLNRFRLTGPLAHSVIKKLEIAPETNVSPWFVEYLKRQRNIIMYNEQVTFWKTLNKIDSTTELSPHLIYNLIVTDPRYNWPLKRTKALKEPYSDEEDIIIPKDIKFGTIWCSKVREEISNNVLNTSQLIEKRRNNLVPSNVIPDDSPVIPIMLIQQPGMKNDNIGYSSGWDIVVPSKWALPFWLNFIMWGGRAGGVKESNLLLFEQGLPDLLYPDTNAGKTEENRMTELYKTKYFSLPPNKRINYVKYGISCPFHYAWKTLIQEWNQENDENSFYVLRDKKQLKTLQETLDSREVINLNINFKRNCLLPVKLTLLKRGKIDKFAIICLPNDNDYKIEPVEPIHKDKNQRTRKDTRDAHKKMLIRLKRQRHRAKEKGEKPNTSEQIITEQLEKMKSLWLPEIDCVRNSCSREIFGLVTAGDFCLSVGKGRCIGYITLGVLPLLFNRKQKNIVLVRNTKSKQYRLAKMEIIYT